MPGVDKVMRVNGMGLGWGENMSGTTWRLWFPEREKSSVTVLPFLCFSPAKAIGLTLLGPHPSMGTLCWVHVDVGAWMGCCGPECRQWVWCRVERSPHQESAF